MAGGASPTERLYMSDSFRVTGGTVTRGLYASGGVARKVFILRAVTVWK